MDIKQFWNKYEKGKKQDFKYGGQALRTSADAVQLIETNNIFLKVKKKLFQIYKVKMLMLGIVLMS